MRSREIHSIAGSIGQLLRAAVLGALVTLMPVRAGADPLDLPMTFKLATNENEDIRWISATGSISADTPKEFEKFTKTLPKTKGLWIVFHSPGGLVVPALRLGDLIRKGGFNTDVAETQFRGDGRDRIVRGYCVSACGLAFLGGVKRDVQEGSLLGYHRFYKDPMVEADPEKDAAAEEVLIDVLGAYLSYMGVGSELLDRTLATDPTDYYEPSDKERVRLRIVTTDEDGDDAASESGGDIKTNLGKRTDAGPIGMPMTAAFRNA